MATYLRFGLRHIAVIPVTIQGKFVIMALFGMEQIQCYEKGLLVMSDLAWYNCHNQISTETTHCERSNVLSKDI